MALLKLLYIVVGAAVCTYVIALIVAALWSAWYFRDAQF